MTANLGIAAAFELSWQELDAAAQQLGSLLSLFALAPIPWSLVESVAGNCQPTEQYGLLQRWLPCLFKRCSIEVFALETKTKLEDARDTLLRLYLLQYIGEGTYLLNVNYIS